MDSAIIGIAVLVYSLVVSAPAVMELSRRMREKPRQRSGSRRRTLQPNLLPESSPSQVADQMLAPIAWMGGITLFDLQHGERVNPASVLESDSRQLLTIALFQAWCDGAEPDGWYVHELVRRLDPQALAILLRLSPMAPWLHSIMRSERSMWV